MGGTGSHLSGSWKRSHDPHWKVLGTGLPQPSGRPGAALPASRSPARGPPQGSCCLRRGNPIHSRPSSPLPCPGALELRGPGHGDASWRPPASLGSSRSRLKKSACQLPPALSAAATNKQGAPEATPPEAAILRPGNFRVPPTSPSTFEAVDELEAMLCAGRVTHFRKRRLGNRKGGFRIKSRTLRPAAASRPPRTRCTEYRVVLWPRLHLPWVTRSLRCHVCRMGWD